MVAPQTGRPVVCLPRWSASQIAMLSLDCRALRVHFIGSVEGTEDQRRVLLAEFARFRLIVVGRGKGKQN